MTTIINNSVDTIVDNYKNVVIFLLFVSKNIIKHF